jgi:lipopolysaccharide/colanic/teichoic acid biosynthesis glycosyltransferase
VYRFIDVVLSVIGLAASAPILLVCVIGHKMTSAGSAIFAQERVGLGRKSFICLKLRTMAPDTPQRATHEISAMSVTPLGKFLRKTKLDELPQLWNVLKGDMSLVGPRPCLPSQTLLIAERDKRGVYQLRPGITGHAQINGLDMSQPERLAEADEYWLQHRSLARYFQILVQTVLGRGSGDRTSAS